MIENALRRAGRMRTGTAPLARAIALLVCLLAFAPGFAAAQSSLFSPVARVDDRVVTAYELEQRQQFLALLGAPPEVVDTALDRLIEERLQQEAAASVGVTVSEDELQSGLAEFAARGNLTLEEFVQAIGGQGIAPETFREFVRAGLVWRDAVRARFASTVDLSDEEARRALDNTPEATTTRVLLSEVVIPATSPAAVEEARREAEAIASNPSFEAFAEAARTLSAAPSAADGGAVDWVPLSSLPPNVAGLVANLRPGEVTPPIPVSNAIAVFQLRAIEQGGTGSQSIDYAEFLIPGGRSQAALAEAARIEAQVDTCDDLYGIARGLPPERLIREARAPGQIPADVAAELSRLDPGEVSTNLTRGNALVFLMLCNRGVGEDAPLIAIEGARQRLTGERLAALAERWLADLRANATIETYR